MPLQKFASNVQRECLLVSLGEDEDRDFHRGRDATTTHHTRLLALAAVEVDGAVVAPSALAGPRGEAAVERLRRQLPSHQISRPGLRLQRQQVATNTRGADMASQIWVR